MESFFSLLIPALIGGVVTLVVAMYNGRLRRAQMLSEIQDNAIKTVQQIEERIRADLRKDLEVLKIENDKLRIEVAELKGMLGSSDRLISTLNEEIVALRGTLDIYKAEMAKNKQRLITLENGSGDAR